MKFGHIIPNIHTLVIILKSAVNIRGLEKNENKFKNKDDQSHCQAVGEGDCFWRHRSINQRPNFSVRRPLSKLIFYVHTPDEKFRKLPFFQPTHAQTLNKSAERRPRKIRRVKRKLAAWFYLMVIKFYNKRSNSRIHTFGRVKTTKLFFLPTISQFKVRVLLTRCFEL